VEFPVGVVLDLLAGVNDDDALATVDEEVKGIDAI
jgi:hypothetical protein